jgi:hypothetical protein
VAGVLDASTEAAILEEDLLQALKDVGLGPAKGVHSHFSKMFAKRVGAVLRKSGLFSKSRKDGRWAKKKGAW